MSPTYQDTLDQLGHQTTCRIYFLLIANCLTILFPECSDLSSFLWIPGMLDGLGSPRS